MPWFDLARRSPPRTMPRKERAVVSSHSTGCCPVAYWKTETAAQNRRDRGSAHLSHAGSSRWTVTLSIFALVTNRLRVVSVMDMRSRQPNRATSGRSCGV